MGAVSPFLFVATLPSHLAFACLLLIGLVALSRRYRVVLILPVVFLVTTLAINQRLAQRLPLAETGSTRTLDGIVASLPVAREDVVRFEFIPQESSALKVKKLLVSWYAQRDRTGTDQPVLPKLRAGEHWRLNLELQSPRGRINFHGMDAERWYFTAGIHALAVVQKEGNLRLAQPDRFNLQHWRETVFDRLAEKAGDAPAFRMLAALALADRRGLEKTDKALLAATGTGHLLAISGLHIGLAAALGFYLGRLALLALPHGFRQACAVKMPWLIAWLAAFTYSALAGFGVSTQRALIMLSVACVLMMSRRNTHPAHAWLMAMGLVLILDPFASLQAGFWFSFIAVGVLMVLFVPRYGQLPAWRKLLLAQFGISLVMAPMGMYWFQQASVPGFLANLVAIPFVSTVIVPLILLALPLMWLPGPLSTWLLTGAGYAMQGLLWFLQQVSGLQPPALAQTVPPELLSTLLAMLGALLMLLPSTRGIPLRTAGALLMLPLFLPPVSQLDDLETRLDFLDVGQGLAVLLSRPEYLLVYDSGPGNGQAGDSAWDMVDGTLQPMIISSGRKPDMVVTSHGDLDHAGGLEKLRTMYPDARYLASLSAKREGIEACHSPMSWNSNGLDFEVLHPTIGLPYLGNDSSCVISVKGAGMNLLLSGDVSRTVEQRLVDNGLSRHDLLSVPHHGSATSSSRVFVDAVQPLLALVSAGWNNRFDFPRDDVIERYRKNRTPVLNTAQCGGIRVTANPGTGLRVESARLARRAIWRWPPGELCPLDG